MVANSSVWIKNSYTLLAYAGRVLDESNFNWDEKQAYLLILLSVRSSGIVFSSNYSFALKLTTGKNGS